MTKRKQRQIEALSTEALERTLSSLGGNEVRAKSPEHPLGGLVHYLGIGQVPVTALRAVAAQRGAAMTAYRVKGRSQ